MGGDILNRKLQGASRELQEVQWSPWNLDTVTPRAWTSLPSASGHEDRDMGEGSY